MRASSRTGFALGVDIGGTFTDLVLLDRATGRVAAGKVLTSYGDVAQAVLEGIHRLLAEHALPAENIRTVVHGTTLVTNALIERRGARTALVVTRGFRDILEMARESRYDIYDIGIEIPAPLVPRARVFEVTERMDRNGRVVTPLAPDEVRLIAHELRAHRLESVAVCLLHAFRNPAHERAIAALLGEEIPGLAVSLSSDVVPDIREYERASTTVANAYVQPAIRQYLDRLSQGFHRLAIRAPLLIMTSDGGTVSGEIAARYPVRLVESGPAGGVLAAAHLAQQVGLRDVIAFDMGGTTAKICIVEDGEPARANDFEVGRVYRFAQGSGLPLRAPVLQMIEIGAGGGSIARGDELGLLKVGPDSAGAAPGPACYGLGGSAPTVTDADLYLGYLDPGHFLGGAMPLHRDRAEGAIRAGVATPLGVSVTRAAWGIHEVVNENMARAAKTHCLERGKDPREYTLVAFGGAGPVHAFRVAQVLGIQRVLFPVGAGVLSAFGFLVAPSALELLRAYIAPLASADVSLINRLYQEMEAEGRALLQTAGVPVPEMTVRREAAVRYTGQSYELAIPVPVGRLGSGDLALIHKDFVRQYQRRYHRLTPDVPTEAVSWRVVVTGPRPRIRLQPRPPARDVRGARKGIRDVYLPEAGEFVSCPVYDRYSLGAGVRFRGPAIVEERESTAVIGPGGVAEVDVYNNLHVTVPVAEDRGQARRLSVREAHAPVRRR
jgi:N-methylhydantoinase A